MSAATSTGLRFTPGNHQYRLDGRPVPSVTTLLGKGLPKPALTYWSAKCVAEWVADNEADVEALRRMGRGPMVNALKGVPWEKRDTAAVRGTDVHALAEELLHGREVEVPDHLANYVDGYVKWLDLWTPEVVLTERIGANRKWHYAGKFDAIFDLPTGERLLCDWKTSAGVYGDTSCQLAAYRGMEFYLDGDSAEMPMPEVDSLAVLHITPTGSDLYRIKDPDAAWKDFLHVAWVANSVDRIKAQIGEPSEPPEVTA
jgi:hypothetical protein